MPSKKAKKPAPKTKKPARATSKKAVSKKATSKKSVSKKKQDMDSPIIVQDSGAMIRGARAPYFTIRHAKNNAGNHGIQPPILGVSAVVDPGFKVYSFEMPLSDGTSVTVSLDGVAIWRLTLNNGWSLACAGGSLVFIGAEGTPVVNSGNYDQITADNTALIYGDLSKNGGLATRYPMDGQTPASPLKFIIHYKPR